MDPIIPVQVNAFKVNFPTQAGKDLNKHVSDARIDFMRKTLTVNVRQSIDYTMLENLLEALRFVGPRVVMKDAIGKNVVRLELINPKLVRHTLALDYSETGHAEHVVQWEYDHMRITDGAPPVPAAHDPTAGYLTPEQAVSAVEASLKASQG